MVGSRVMNDAEKKALFGIGLIAAYADGEKSDAEKALIERAGAGLGFGPLDVPELYEHAASGLLTAKALTDSLTRREQRLLAYEMALGVCEADDELNEAERAFLKELQGLLGLDDAAVASARAASQQLQSQVLAPADAVPPVLPAAAAESMPPTSGVERLILEHAILCGGMELLPEALATMAILPTQMRMVYAIGKTHGVSLDRGHIKEFLMAAGVGLTSQVLEGYATKLAKGLLGKFLGGVGRVAAGPVTGAAMSFCTTYALGHVANQYYASGRSLSRDQLRAAFDGMMGKARELSVSHRSDIEACSRKLRVQNLIPGVSALPE